MILDVNNRDDLEIFLGGAAGTIGVTSGCFDLFHDLHRLYLERCRRKCKVLVVGVNSDDLIRAEKGEGRPIIPEHQRVSMVNAQKSVTAAFMMEEVDDLRRMIGHLIAPNKYLYVFRNQDFVGRTDVAGTEHHWAKLVIIPDVEAPDSTTAIIDKIAEQGTGQTGET